MPYHPPLLGLTITIHARLEIKSIAAPDSPSVSTPVCAHALQRGDLVLTVNGIATDDVENFERVRDLVRATIGVAINGISHNT